MIKYLHDIVTEWAMKLQGFYPFRFEMDAVIVNITANVYISVNNPRTLNPMSFLGTHFVNPILLKTQELKDWEFSPFIIIRVYDYNYYQGLLLSKYQYITSIVRSICHIIKVINLSSQDWSQINDKCPGNGTI
jgi:hypothetical protein